MHAFSKIFMRISLWAYGVVVRWAYGIVVRWAYGIVVRWAYGIVVRWAYGVVVRWAYGVVVSSLVFTAAIRVRISFVAVKFHNYDHIIVRHPWQVSENHKPRVHPSHAREIGQSVRYLIKHKIEL